MLNYVTKDKGPDQEGGKPYFHNHYSSVAHPFLLPSPTLQVDIAPIELKELTKFFIKRVILP